MNVIKGFVDQLEVLTDELGMNRNKKETFIMSIFSRLFERKNNLTISSDIKKKNARSSVGVNGWHPSRKNIWECYRRDSMSGLPSM